MTAGFLIYKTGWTEVSFNKIGKMKFQAEMQSLVVTIMNSSCCNIHLLNKWINGPRAQRRDVN